QQCPEVIGPDPCDFSWDSLLFLFTCLIEKYQRHRDRLTGFQRLLGMETRSQSVDIVEHGRECLTGIPSRGEQRRAGQLNARHTPPFRSFICGLHHASSSSCLRFEYSQRESFVQSGKATEVLRQACPEQVEGPVLSQSKPVVSPVEPGLP